MTSVAIYTLSVLAIFSHPASVVLTPVLLWRFAKARGLERLVWFSLCGAIGTYLIFGIDHSGSTQIHYAGVSFEAFRGYAERVVFESIFGTQLRMELIWRNLNFLAWIFAISGTVLLLFLTSRKQLVFALISISVLLIVFSNVTRGNTLEISYGHRYSMVSSWIFFVAIFVGLTPILSEMNFKLHRSKILTVFAFWAAIACALQAKYFSLPEEISRQGRQLADVTAAISQDNNGYCYSLERGTWSFRLAEGVTC